MRTVGVVVCVYNGSEFVDSCLASVAAQSRQPDRVVVVDDGSTDDSAARVESWKSRLPIQVIAHEVNQGLGAARRTAIGALDADVAVILDVDDIWLPDHLEVMCRTYEHNGGIVMPSALDWRPTERLDLRPRIHRHPVPTPGRQLKALILMNFVFGATLFAIDDYRRHGPFRDLPCSEDWDLWLRMSLGGIAVSVAPTPTYLYRVHGGSMSSDDGTLHGEILVLESFRERLGDPALLRVVDRSLQHRRARVALQRAYDAARDERLVRARMAAVGALWGPRGVGHRAMAMLVAPQATVRRRDQSNRR